MTHTKDWGKHIEALEGFKTSRGKKSLQKNIGLGYVAEDVEPMRETQ